MQEIKCLEPNENIELARILNLPQESESRDGAASIVFKKVKIKTDKQEETKLKLMFDPLDTEGRNMLDVYQIRKFLEKSSLNQPPYYLYEKDVRQLLNEITSLSKSYCVTRKEFPQLLEFFSTQQNELNSLTQPYSLPDAYEKYCTPPNKFEFCTEEIPRVSLLDYESYKSLKLDSFHAAVVDFLFSKPSFVNQSIQWNGIIPDDYFHSIRYAETIQERLPAPLLRRRHIEPPRPKLLFELFTPLYKYKDHAVSLSGVRPKQQLTKPKSRYHVLNLEPVTIGNDGSAPPEQLSYSVALYDQNSQEKITEDIYIENTNSAKVISLMKNQSQGLPIICVVKVFRTTGDDITAARDLYLKGFEDKKAKKKYLERKNIDGKQLLLVGFAAMKDEFEKKSGMVPLKFFKFENETESIFNVFQSQFEGRKQVEMSSKISFQEFFEYDRLVLGVTPYSDVECETPIHIIDNLTRIKQTEDMIHEFINRLFVYPLEVTLGKERKKAFVQVLIQLWENGKPLKCIYPTNGNDFSDSGVSSVTTGKSLIFSDEVKIELPFPLNEKHQLVFIIKLKHDNDEFKQYYSVVPLYAKHILIQSGKMTCPLVPDINARAEENNKRFITFSLNLLSSIYPSTPMSHATINTVIDGKVDNNIHQIPLIDSIHFFPHMLKSFLQSNMVTNITVLELFMKTICGHCSSSEKRNSVAQKYIDHYCTFKSTDVANHLIKALKLMYKYNPNSPQTDVFKHCWLVFEILLKSLQMVGAEKSFWENAHQFVCVFADTIKTHVIKREILGMEEGNAHISYFIRSLMELGFKAHSVKLMESYLDHLVMPYEPEKNSQLDDNSAELIALTMLKTQFLAVYEGSLFLYESSNPGQIDVSDITMLDDMLWIRHLPIAYLMRQHLLLLSRNEEINRISLYLVVGLVARLDLNAELQGEEKENAAAMFLPFVMQFLERYDDFVGWKFVDKHESNTTSVLEKKDDKKKTDSSQLHSTPPQNVSDMEMLGLLCFWVLKNFNRNTLKEWIFNEVPSRLETLIEVLRRYCMLFSYFPLKETIDVYEEIERNIKLIVNGLKEHRYYMPVIPQMPGFEGMLPFMENFPNKPFLIPFQKSLRPMRNDDEGHTILHKFLTDEIVRVCLDMFGLIFDSLLKQESYDLLEKLKGIIATNLFEEKVLNDDVFVFIKNLIIKHRKHIFCGNEEFSVKLLTSFIHTFNSDSARIRGRAVEVLYLYTKNNYIESGNISRTVSLLTTAVVETSDIKMEHFEASVEALKSTQDADIETTTTAVVSIKHDLIEPSYKSLRSRKTIMRTESLGDVEALSVFLKSIIVSRINDLQYLSNLFTTPINGYNQLIDDFVHKKIVVDDQLMEQLQYLVNQFEELTVAEQVNETVKETVSKWEELQILEKKLKVISDERKQDETNIGNICISLRDMCLQGICWAIDKIQKIMNTTTIDLFEQVSLAEIASEKCVIEAETMVDKYKNTMKIVESNPLFPVSVNEFSEIVKGVSDAYKSSATILRTAYNLQKKAQDHENYINERNVQVVTLLQDTLSDILFGLDEFNSGLKAHEISQIRKIKEDEPKSNYGHSTPLEFYEKTLPTITNVLAKIERVFEKTSNNKQRMNAAEEWYLSERKYIQETLTLNEWTTWVKLIKRIHVHETGVTVPVITKIVEDIGKFGDDVTSRLEECVNLQSSLQKVIDDERFGQKKVLGRRRTTRKSLMIEDRNLKRTSSRELEDNQDKVFGCIEGENSFVGGILKRLEKTVAVTQKDFVQVQQKWELIAQKEKYKNIVREKAVSVWEEAKIQKKINWSQLKELLMEGIDEVIQYDDTVDLISDEPKYNTPMSEQNKTQTTESKILLKPPQPKIGISINRASQPDHSKPRERSASASKGTRRQYRKSKSSIAISGPITEAAVVDDFIQSDQFVSDAFLDVNLYRLTQYKSAMKKLQKDITQILCKRQQLDKEKELSRDPDAYAERNLHFARDYLDAPRLHLEWFEKICEENKVRGRFLEGGLCKVHIICFIASFLKDGEAFKELHQIAPDNAEIILQHTTDTYNEEDSKQQKTDTFTEKDLKHHLDEAYQLFTMKHTEDFALLFLQSVISYFEATHNYSQLQLFHEKLTAVYNKKMGYVKSDIHFYYVAFYGEAFAGLENKEFIYQSADSIEGITEVIIGIAPLKEKKNVKVLERGAVASSILPGSLCVKVEEVTPVFDDYETTNTLTTNHFMSQYVHNLKDGHVDELSIRRIVYETKQKLPSAIRRERITGKVKDVFMSPFESSLDKIDTLAFQLQKAIIPPITEELTDILKNILLDDMGPDAMVIAFLKNGIEKYQPEQIKEMWDLLNNLHKVLKTALQRHLHYFPNRQDDYNRFVTSFSNFVKDLESVRDAAESIIADISDDLDDLDF